MSTCRRPFNIANFLLLLLLSIISTLPLANVNAQSNNANLDVNGSGGINWLRLLGLVDDVPSSSPSSSSSTSTSTSPSSTSASSSTASSTSSPSSSSTSQSTSSSASSSSSPSSSSPNSASSSSASSSPSSSSPASSSPFSRASPSPSNNATKMTVTAFDDVSIKILANMSIFGSSNGSAPKIALDKLAKVKVLKMVNAVLNTLMAQMPAVKQDSNVLKFTFMFDLEMAVNTVGNNQNGTSGFVVNFNNWSNNTGGGDSSAAGGGAGQQSPGSGGGNKLITINANMTGDFGAASSKNNSQPVPLNVPTGNVTNGTMSVSAGGINVTINLDGTLPAQVIKNNAAISTAGCSLNVTGLLNGLVPTVQINGGGGSGGGSGNASSDPSNNGLGGMNISVNLGGLLPLPNVFGVVQQNSKPNTYMPSLSNVQPAPGQGNNGLVVNITLTLPNSSSGSGGGNTILKQLLNQNSPSSSSSSSSSNGNQPSAQNAGGSSPSDTSIYSFNVTVNGKPVMSLNGSNGTNNSNGNSGGGQSQSPNANNGGNSGPGGSSSINVNVNGMPGSGGAGNGGPSQNPSSPSGNGINVMLSGLLPIMSFNGLSPSNGFFILPYLSLINSGMFPSMSSLMTPGGGSSGGGLNITLNGVIPIAALNGNPLPNNANANGPNGGGNGYNVNFGGGSPGQSSSPFNVGIGINGGQSPGGSGGSGQYPGLNITITITLAPGTSLEGGNSGGIAPGGGGGMPGFRITITINGFLPPASDLIGMDPSSPAPSTSSPPTSPSPLSSTASPSPSPSPSPSTASPSPSTAAPSPVASTKTTSTTTTTAAPTTTTTPCPAGGVWSDWGAVTGTCTKNCGNCGSKSQSRTCVSQSYGCPCSGASTRQISCPAQPCTFPDPSCCSGKPAKSTAGGKIACP